MLDEPSIGLHTRDTAKLIRILEELRDLGNTILVVEHDPDVIRAADWLVDLGPGAGELGGRILASGTVEEVERNPDSLTGRYLSGQLTIPIPTRRREPMREKLVLRGARIHNLNGLDVEIPMGMLVCITGVSGSGKSTLVHDVLYPAVAHALGKNEGGDPSHLYRELKGAERLNDIVLVDQAPIGRTPRSNPVTYIKAFDAIRELFAAQPEAQRRGYTAGHFSFNVPGGRCDVCEGDGTVTVEMQFLADVELPCEECNGTRYKASVLEVKYKGKSIHDVLNLTVKEALRFFTGQTADPGEAGGPRRGRAGICAAGPVGDHALGWGGAAGQTGGASFPGAQRRRTSRQRDGEEGRQPGALHPGRADHRTALRRCEQAVDRLQAADRRRRLAGGDRAQPGRDQVGGLGDRPGSGGGCGRRPGGGGGNAGAGGADARLPYRTIGWGLRWRRKRCGLGNEAYRVSLRLGSRRCCWRQRAARRRISSRREPRLRTARLSGAKGRRGQA